jgi:hypothetical protein
MNKVIILPTIFKEMKSVLSDQFPQLFKQVKRKTGSELIYTDSLNGLPKNAGSLLIFVNAHARALALQAASLSKKTRLLLYIAAPHWTDQSFAPAIKRADVILSGSRRLLLKRWPEAAGKLIFIGNFFAPHRRYVSLNRKADQTMRCLMTGHKNRDVYPFRAFVKNLVIKDRSARSMIKIMLHPRWEKRRPRADYEIPAALNGDYARVLNQYHCGIASGSRFGYVLAKYFEIPAAGSLLLAPRVSDAAEIGLIPGRHYVAVNERNLLSTVADCLAYPWKYRKIKEEGTRYVRKYHSVKNRAAGIAEVFDG